MAGVEGVFFSYQALAVESLWFTVASHIVIRWVLYKSEMKCKIKHVKKNMTFREIVLEAKVK